MQILSNKQISGAALKIGEEFEFEFNNSQMIVNGANKAGYFNFDVSDEDKWYRVEGFVDH